MKKLLALFLLTSTVLLGGLRKRIRTSRRKRSQDLQVITTFYPMYEFTKGLLEIQVKYLLLIPAGTEPHDYEPVRKIWQKLWMQMLLCTIVRNWKHGCQQ